MFGHDQPYTIQSGTVVVGEPTLPISKWMAQPPTCSKWTESTTWWWWITFHAIQKLSNCSHCSSQVYLFLTWYSRGGEERQWSSVCIPRVCHFQRVVMFMIHKLTSLHGDTTRSWLTIPTSSQSRAHCTLLVDKNMIIYCLSPHLGTVHNKFEVCSQNSGFTHFHQVNWSNTNTRDVVRKHSQLSLTHELPFQFLIHSCWSKPNGCWSSLLSLPLTSHLHSVDPVPVAIGQGTWVAVRFRRHFLTTTRQPFPERFRNRWRN